MKPVKLASKSRALLATQQPVGQQFFWSQYPTIQTVSLSIPIQYHAYSVNTGHAETANEKNARQRQQVGFATLRSCVKPAPKRTNLAQVAFKSERQGFDQVDQQN